MNFKNYNHNQVPASKMMNLFTIKGIACSVSSFLKLFSAITLFVKMNPPGDNVLNEGENGHLQPECAGIKFITHYHNCKDIAEEVFIILYLRSTKKSIIEPTTMV